MYSPSKCLISSSVFLCPLMATPVYAASTEALQAVILILALTALIMGLGVLIVAVLTRDVIANYLRSTTADSSRAYGRYLENLSSSQIEIFLKSKKITGR